MAWNEPGGGNNNSKDPWGSNNRNDGPPDLDDALKKLQEKFGGLFGGGKGGKSGGSGPFMVIVVIALIVWLVSGFYTINEQERAVVLRFGEYIGTKQPGLRWNPPLIDQRLVVNSTKLRSASFSETMLTQDENIVVVDLSVQYDVPEPEKFVLQVRDPESSLRHSAQSALRHVVGSTEMDLVLTQGRGALAIEVQQRTQEYLDLYETGIRISTVNIDDAQPPAPVQAAFDDVIKAREDEERRKSEAEAYDLAVVPEARGQAQRQLEDAEAYKERVVAYAQGEADRFTRVLAEYERAPEVTRDRLYLDALQSVYSNTSKVMVDVEGGNNVLYLPLDKMAERSAAANATTVDVTKLNIRDLANAVAEQLRREAASGQRTTRGGR